MILRPGNKFHNDEEVAREVHGDDHVKLGFKTGLVFRTFGLTLLFIRVEEFKTLFKSLSCLHAQTVSRAHITGVVMRQTGDIELNINITALSDDAGVIESLGYVSKKLTHFSAAS